MPAYVKNTPACGSGAFLFAALNILEPLYTAAIEGMRGFVADLERSGRPPNPHRLRDFQDILNNIARHPSERYYILKSIVLNNLYGVDIMAEATEICRLRLFLKLVAQLETYDQIEPLPDIDFNIRAGNTLVGFTGLDAVQQAMTVTPDGQYRALDAGQRDALRQIEQDAAAAAAAFEKFRQQQTTLDGSVSSSDKVALSNRLDNLRARLNRHLAGEYGVSANDANAYAAWQNSHQPFHWLVEFYGIMRNGGFDAVIGNPPYVEYSKVRKDYTIKGYHSESSGNLYAFVMERSNGLKSADAWFGMITPISITSADRMKSLRSVFESQTTYSANFADRPSGLFTGVHQILTILIVEPGRKADPVRYSAGFRHWNSEERDNLFSLLTYQASDDCDGDVWVKSGQEVENAIIAKMMRDKTAITDYIQSGGDIISVCGGTGGYWLRAFDGTVSSNEYKTHRIPKADRLAVCAALNSGIFYWFWRKVSNCRHLNIRDTRKFKLDLNPALREELNGLGAAHLAALRATREYRSGKMAYEQYRPASAKAESDAIDRALARHYGLTDAELDFIINYDIKYRMGSSD